MTAAFKSLGWSHGSCTVQRLGAMIGPAVFLLPDGRQVSPLQVAPWADEPGANALPGILQRLRGEWPCVPFGYSVPAMPDTPAEWASLLGPAEAGEEVHGPSSNQLWDWAGTGPDGSIAMTLDYPADHPVRRIERTLRARPDSPAMDFTLRIETRAACQLPLGLHFTFRLPQTSFAARIEPGAFRTGRTYPGTVERGASAFAIGQVFDRLDRVPDRDGGITDAASLPFDRPVEELLQLDGTAGTAALANLAENWRARISWDPTVFPSLLLWYSNRGRSAFPWNGRHLALGMEPICSPFGLGPATARADNPVSRGGTPTTRAFTAGEVFETRYSLAVEPLEQG
jgi:hypothetical protein